MSSAEFKQSIQVDLKQLIQVDSKQMIQGQKKRKRDEDSSSDGKEAKMDDKEAKADEKGSKTDDWRAFFPESGEFLREPHLYFRLPTWFQPQMRSSWHACILDLIEDLHLRASGQPPKDRVVDHRGLDDIHKALVNLRVQVRQMDMGTATDLPQLEGKFSHMACLVRASGAISRHPQLAALANQIWGPTNLNSNTHTGGFLNCVDKAIGLLSELRNPEPSSGEQREAQAKTPTQSSQRHTPLILADIVDTTMRGFFWVSDRWMNSGIIRSLFAARERKDSASAAAWTQIAVLRLVFIVYWSTRNSINDDEGRACLFWHLTAGKHSPLTGIQLLSGLASVMSEPAPYPQPRSLADSKESKDGKDSKHAGLGGQGERQLPLYDGFLGPASLETIGKIIIGDYGDPNAWAQAYYRKTTRLWLHDLLKESVIGSILPPAITQWIILEYACEELLLPDGEALPKMIPADISIGDNLQDELDCNFSSHAGFGPRGLVALHAQASLKGFGVVLKKMLAETANDVFGSRRKTQVLAALAETVFRLGFGKGASAIEFETNKIKRPNGRVGSDQLHYWYAFTLDHVDDFAPLYVIAADVLGDSTAIEKYISEYMSKDGSKSKRARIAL